MHDQRVTNRQPFYEECAATLQQAFAAQPLVLGAFSRLATTCDSLAVDQLLTAMGDATCSDLEPLVQPTAGGFGRWLDEQLDCPLGMLEHQLVDIDTACCGASLQALGDECCKIAILSLRFVCCQSR